MDELERLGNESVNKREGRDVRLTMRLVGAGYLEVKASGSPVR